MGLRSRRASTSVDNEPRGATINAGFGRRRARGADHAQRWLAFRVSSWSVVGGKYAGEEPAVAHAAATSFYPYESAENEHR